MTKPERPTPETNSHAEWLRARAVSPYFALARAGLLDSANAIERLERERDALREALRELYEAGNDFPDNDSPEACSRYANAIDRARAILGEAGSE